MKEIKNMIASVRDRLLRIAKLEQIIPVPKKGHH